MTDEQIKQNAKAYADNAMKVPAYTRAYDSFIAGAHSRDEEIWQLHDVINDYSETIDKLRNPWISVEERLPKEGQDVLICIWTGSVIRNNFMSIGDINHMKSNRECYKCWMPTPMPKSDEK